MIRRIRLKSIILVGREKLLAWARSYGSFRGSRFPDTGGPADEESDDQDDGEGREWEDKILGMWNRTLEMLADHDYGQGEAHS